MSDSEAILAANDAFYSAFVARDIAAMNAIWAQRAPVICVHPGWAPLLGRAAVLASWTAILENPNQPRVRFREPEVRIVGEVAFVVGLEEIDGNRLAVTNCFVAEDGAWRMVHHQSGPAAPPPPERRAPRRATGTVH